MVEGNNVLLIHRKENNKLYNERARHCQEYGLFIPRSNNLINSYVQIDKDEDFRSLDVVAC